MARPPTSTIVLAVATCLPFGLALRDTLAGKYDEPPDVLAEYERELAARHAIERDAERDVDEAVDHDLDGVVEEAALRNAAYDRSRQQAEQALRANRLAHVPALYGAEPATPGTDLAGFRLGAPSADDAQLDVETWRVTVRSDGVSSLALEVDLVPRDEAVCTALERGLREHWGDPKLQGRRWVWLDRPGTVRATWERDDCELRYERVGAPATWLDRTRTSTIPLWAIGRPERELRHALGARAIADQATYHVRWTAPGLGIGRGPADVTAHLDHGRVVALEVGLEIDPAAQTALSDQISKLVGKPPEIPSDRPDAEIWNTVPRIELVEGAPKTFLTIGIRP